MGTGIAGQYAQQGFSVALSADGKTAILGGPYDDDACTACPAYGVGAAWVFTRSGNTWTQQGSKLVGSGAVGPSGQGRSVALSADGNTAMLGGPGDNNDAGAAWVFARSNGVWRQQGSKLVGKGAVEIAEQGYSVSLSSDGNAASLGGPGDNNSAGAVWEFARSNGVWSQANKLIGSGVVGLSRQGTSVSLSADSNTTIVGGPGDTNGAGAAWIFQ